MLRALAVFVGLLLTAGVYVLIMDPAEASAAAPTGPRSGSFGFALAAGAIALAATMMVARPQRRMRR